MQGLNARQAISLLAAAVALTACGGGDTGNTTAPPATQVAAATCATPPQLFTATVWPTLSSTCVVCHRAGAVASGTRLVFAAGGSAEVNYGILRTFASANSDLLMSKSIGLPTHTGGKVLGDANSQQYKDLASLLPKLKESCSTEVIATGQFWNQVQFADNATTLGKAAHLFAGRPPTETEYSTVAAGGDAALRMTMRGYMDGGPSFDRFMTEVGHTQFLVNGVVVLGQNRGLDARDWPMAAAVINNQNAPAGVRARFDTTMRNEPINLLKYITKNDRPATELVAGSYTVVTGLVAPLLGAQVTGTFMNPADDNEFLPATLPNARLGGNYRHSGVLTQHAYLDRLPTTDTNRNRHRISETMRRFAAMYIPELASRPLEDGVFRLPTMDNPGCAVCHDVMDPMAAGFQNFAPNNRFRPNGTGAMAHSLPQVYLANNYPTDAKGNRYYQDNDNWYRDAKAPGYGSTPMPMGYNNPGAEQWLGQQIANDPRFALGMTHFMYKGLTGREPLRAPADTSGPEAAGRLAAYNAQHDDFNQVAQSFAAGGYKIKDLLVGLMMSKSLRATGVTGTVTTERASSLAEIGGGKLLTATMLNQKLAGLVGSGAPELNNAFAGAALGYTNFNGIDRNSRQTDFTSTQVSVGDQIVVRNSCRWTMADFNKPMATRMLFPGVSMTDTPVSKASSDKILVNLTYLMKRLWLQDVTTSDPEVQRVYDMMAAVYADRANQSPMPLSCELNDGNDPTYSGRMWSAAVMYMITDPKFLTW